LRLEMLFSVRLVGGGAVGRFAGHSVTRVVVCVIDAGGGLELVDVSGSGVGAGHVVVGWPRQTGQSPHYRVVRMTLHPIFEVE
jgi:hypothetical protein